MNDITSTLESSIKHDAYQPGCGRTGIPAI